MISEEVVELALTERATMILFTVRKVGVLHFYLQ